MKKRGRPYRRAREDEIANEAGSVTGLSRNRYRRATYLTPYDHQACRIAAVPALPAYRHPAIRARQRAVFGGVRHKLLQHHPQRLGCRGGECYVGAANRRICVRRVGSKLAADNIREANALPVTLAQ